MKGIPYFEGILIVFGTTQVIAFNLINPMKGYKFSTRGKERSEFGYAVAIASHNEEKWLYVGAPKHGADGNNVTSPSDGSIFYCSLGTVKEDGDNCFSLDLQHSRSSDNHTSAITVNFETETFEQVKEVDDFDWLWHRGTSSSAKTGPPSDHTFAADGKRGRYMLIEGSLPRVVGETAMLITPQLSHTTGSCVRFWYHMYGEDMGSLNVYITSQISGTRMIWSISGDQNNTWYEASVSVISEEPYKVIFEGVIGQDYKSDIGLDDVSITLGLCPDDVIAGTGSLGMMLKQDSLSGKLLSCSPTWKYSCKGQNYMTGLCYLLDGQPKSFDVTMMSPCRYPVCNNRKLDIVFLIDGSDSINTASFKQMIRWLRNVVSSIVVKGQTQIAIAQFSSSPLTEFNLNQYTSIEDLRKVIVNITHMKGNTATGKAIDYINSEMFNITNGMRPDAEHVAVVITDGKSQDSVVSPSQAIKSRGITVFAIGVAGADKTELNEIASDPAKDFVFSVEKFDALDGISSRLQEKIFSLESQSNRSTFTTEQCQAGMSGAFIHGHPVIGLPGLQDWTGGYADYQHDGQTAIKVSLEEILEKETRKTTSPLSSLHLSPPANRNSYFGSSMTTGSYSHLNSQEIAIGSPTLQSKGGVFILNVTDSFNPILLDYFMGKQLGSNFGYTVCMTDLNNDGISELLVGSPLFFDKYPDEGKVTVFVSDSDQLLKVRKAFDIYGSLEENARFGYSIAAAGDLNGDGFGDIAVGAPGSFDGNGAIYIYNGRENLKASWKPSQVVRSNSYKTKPLFFGFSIDSGIDVDGNGYPDISVGAPGSDEAFVILSRPVIHVNAEIRGKPDTVNVSRSSCFLPEKFAIPFVPKACSSIELCFTADGKNIPQVLLLEYKLIVDKKHSRAIAVNPRNEIFPTKKRSCVVETLAFKESIHDFSDVDVGVEYKLSSKLNYSDESPILDIYDKNPVYTKIKITRWCKNPNCESDMSIQATVQGLSQVNGAESLVMKEDKIITVNLEWENTEDIALLPNLQVVHSNGLYFSHVTQDRRCVETIEDEATLSQRQNSTQYQCIGMNCTSQSTEMKRVWIKYKNPVMKSGSSCQFQLKFGLINEKAFYENNLTISLHATSSSKDLHDENNNVHISIPVFFTASPTLKGYPSRHEIRLSHHLNASNVTTSLDEIGPHISITYSVSNVGSWDLPPLSLQAEWPVATSSGDMILYPVSLVCTPKDKCKCTDQPHLFNSYNLSNSEDRNSSMEESNNSTDGINLYKEINMDCEDDKMECAQSRCVISSLSSQNSVQMIINFRIWETTVYHLEAWKVNIISNSLLTPLTDDHHIFQSESYNSKVTFAALGLDNDPNDNPDLLIVRLWVIIVGVAAGLLLLSLLMLMMYKAKFFESKYKRKKEESLKWQDYKYPSLQEGRIKIQLKAEAGKETVITKLSTFQR